MPEGAYLDGDENDEVCEAYRHKRDREDEEDTVTDQELLLSLPVLQHDGIVLIRSWIEVLDRYQIIERGISERDDCIVEVDDLCHGAGQQGLDGHVVV